MCGGGPRNLVSWSRGAAQVISDDEAVDAVGADRGGEGTKNGYTCQQHGFFKFFRVRFSRKQKIG